jgi:hypothetical protein
MSIIIDEEFKNLIPPLSEDEFRQLEENCVRDGIREPLVVWKQDNGDSILIDGHNRFKIIAKHMLHYTEQWMQFKDRDEAKAWIIMNQFGRRNLSTYDRSVLALKLKPLIAEKAKQKEHERKMTSQKSDESHFPEIDTKKELAKVAGVSHDTIHKVEVIEAKATPALKEDVKNGDLSINKAYQIVTGTVSKSPKKLMDEFVESKKEAHEDFIKKKEESVVSFSDATEDRKNLEVLTNDFYRKFLKISKPVFDIWFEMQNDKSIDDTLKALTPKQREEMRQTLKHTTAQLLYIERRLVQSE